VSAVRPYPVGAGKDPRTPLLIEQAPRNINYASLDWDGIMAILRDAERGRTERLADLTRRMLRDGHYASCTETRKLAVATAKVAIEPGSEDEVDVRGAEDAQRMIDGLPMARIKKDAADGIITGWACLQIFWEIRGAWLWPAKVEWNHPRRFRFGYDFKPFIYDDGRAAKDQSKLTAEEQKRCQELGINGMPLEPYRWIVHMPRAMPDYPQMGGVAVQAVTPWWIKMQAIRYQLAGAEQSGNGRVWGEQDPNADPVTKDAFKEHLAAFGAGEVLVTSPGAKVNFVNPLAQGSSSVWTSLISDANSDISKAVLGSTLAVEPGKNGNRSLGDTQAAVTIDPRAEVDDDEIRATLHRDLVDVFLELNRWAYGGQKPNVRTTSVWVEEEATIDELALKTGLITENQFLQSRGLPAIEGGDTRFVTLPEMGAPFGLPTEPASADLPTAADGTKVEAVADTALNGAQVTSLSELLAGVAAGTLAPEAAILFIVSSFPSIPQERAQAMVNAQAAMAPPAVAPTPEAAPLAALPDIAVGSQWTDTSDDHAITVTAIGNGRVYFTDADYVNEKGVAQPTRQHSYAEPTFRERCSPIAAPGGAPAGLPLRDGGEDGAGRDAAPTLSTEAHGDLYALSDEVRADALLRIGHPGLLTAQAMLDGVPLWERLRGSLIDAAGKATSVATLSGALASWQKRKGADLSTQLYEVALQGRMAGALFVAQYEAPEVFSKGPVALAADGSAPDPSRTPPFLSLPFDEAIAEFESRRIVTPEEFEGMDEDARSSAFTATQLAHETLVARARDLLLRTLRDGGTFEDFRRALTGDESALGVTPSSPWYLETVYRTNVQMSYGAGRLELLTSPAVQAARPYLERRTARDDRVRETHAALEGAIYENGSEAATANAPPYLDGELQFNCRCVLVARRAEDVDASRVVG